MLTLWTAGFKRERRVTRATERSAQCAMVHAGHEMGNKVPGRDGKQARSHKPAFG